MKSMDIRRESVRLVIVGSLVFLYVLFFIVDLILLLLVYTEPRKSCFFLYLCEFIVRALLFNLASYLD